MRHHGYLLKMSVECTTAILKQNKIKTNTQQQNKMPPNQLQTGQLGALTRKIIHDVMSNSGVSSVIGVQQVLDSSLNRDMAEIEKSN